ncbi:MAG: ROK family protein, partial [Armatimonadetes bacterium]|nr:ROK family protein [Armatimonadota bacterium]
MQVTPLDSEGTHVAGVDIGGTSLKCGIFDRAGTLLHRTDLASEAEQGFDHFLGRIAGVVRQGVAEAGLRLASLAGVGLGYPGTCHPDTGLISGSPNIPGSENRDLVRPLFESLGRPLRVGNDASVAALGECLYGLGRERGVKDMAFFTLGTGVGGGLILGGRMFYGSHGQGTELGHQIVDPDGPLCGCGCFGCLEAFCGTAGILRAAWRRLQAGRRSLLWRAVRAFEDPELTPKMISDAAALGDEVALEVWDEIGFYLGLGCVSVINVVDPEVIVFGGGIAETGEPLFGAIRRTVRARQRLNPWPVENILPARLGNDASVAALGECLYGLGRE